MLSNKLGPQENEKPHDFTIISEVVEFSSEIQNEVFYLKNFISHINVIYALESKINGELVLAK